MQYSFILPYFSLSFIWAVTSLPSDGPNIITRDIESANVNQQEYQGHIPYFNGKSDYQQFPTSGKTCDKWTLTKSEVDEGAKNACTEFKNRKRHMWFRTKNVKGLYYNPQGKRKFYHKRHYMYPLQVQQSVGTSDIKQVPYLFIDRSCKMYAIYIRSKGQTRKFGVLSTVKFRPCWDARTKTVQKLDDAGATNGITSGGAQTAPTVHNLKQREINSRTPTG